jgi:PEP-CTERM motif
MKSYVIAAFAAFALAPAAHATSVVNGNFETGPFGVAPSGFVVSPGAEIVALRGSDYIPCCGVTGSSAQLANHFASFGPGNIANTSTLSQQLSTIAGRRYIIGFDFGVLGGGAQTIFANAFNTDGNQLIGSLSATQSANNNLGATFSRYTFEFVALGSGTLLSFNVDPFTDGVDGILDNVSAAVPEPATWAMMIAGFGLAGAALRRRRVSVVYA